MRMKFLALIIIASALLISSATAINVCCEKTGNEYCVYADETKCDKSLKDAAINCEQTSFCKVGCCYSSDEGECYTNVAKAKCESVQGSTWTDSETCSIPQCQKGCCILGSQGFFVTEVKCKMETSKYSNVTMLWKPEILSEPECQAQAKSQEMGCCVTADNKCSFTTREKCSSASTTVTAVNQTFEGFHKDMLCSNDMLSCGCAKQTDTGCYDDKVYWFDSCGNRENVYSSDKTKSYNNGYVLDPDQICASPATQSPNCGNCDYSEGSICRKAQKTKPEHGDFICSTTKCPTTYNDGVSPNAGSPKKNGESWCLYDTAVGKAQDPVGSRHFRRMCINGEEMTEPCMDYREEICIQGVLGEDPKETIKAFQAKGDYIEAACRDNRWEDCFKCNEAKACGASCAGKGIDCCIKKCCENEALRDCYYIASTQSAKAAKQSENEAPAPTGYCAPQVPPGLQFWPSSTAELPTSTTRSQPATTAAVTTGSQQGALGGTGPNSNAESVCSQANQECKVQWYIGGTGKLGIGGLGTQTEYKCVQNCQCTEPEWVIGGNTLCKALGDCGAKFNFLGTVTLDGYSNTASEEKQGEKGLYFDGYKLTEKDVGDWKTLLVKGQPLKDESKLSMSNILKNFGVPLMVFAASGMYSSAMGGKFLTGATSGLSWITTGLGYVFSLGKGKSPTASAWAETISAGKPLGNAVFSKEGLIKGGFKGTSQFEGYTYDSATKLYTSNELPTAQYNLEQMTTTMKYKPTGETFDGFKSVGDGYQSLDPNALAKGEMTAQPGATGNMMGTINTIMWLYTIYKLIDMFFADTKEKTYNIACAPWVAPTGGADCEKCNTNKEKPCSLYRCKSLGQNCYLVNQGTSEEKCTNLNPNDVNSPIISPWPEVIPKGYTITPTTDEGNKGYKINEKIGPYDSITLGIKVNEAAQCKFTDKIGTDFDEMASFFGEGQYVYEHQTTFVIPAEFTTKEALKKLGDTYNLYIRCKDASGNKNEKDYFIRFSLKPEPDMTAPKIEKTSIENNAYISNNATKTGFSIYVNERAECKYDVLDKDFDLMEKKFDCSTSPFSFNSVYYGMYDCKTTLILTNMTKLQWYIRCKDTANNKNRESYAFSLTPTPPLEITSTGPTGTFYEASVTLTAQTANGAESGKAKCAYSTKDDQYGNMILFLKTDSATHEQPLTPGVGEFTYYIKCLDIAGNQASSNATFKIDVDLEAPKILYIYVTPSNYLHVEMNEASTCEYSNSTFTFGTGLPMTGAGTAVHELSITEKTYNIACQDIYANEARFVVYP